MIGSLLANHWESHGSRYKHYVARYYKEGIEDRIPERWSKEVRRYHFEALNGIHHWEEDIIDFFKARMSAVTEGNVYLELRIKSVVQDKLHHILLEFLKDFNNAFFMFIRRIVIKNRVEDIQLGVERYQRTLNLTKPTIFFEGIDQRIPFTMTTMHKGVVYLNQYNIKSLMKLSEVKKFSDGTLVKIQKNLIDILSKNKLGSGNKRLKGREWTDYDVKSSKEMLKKIDEILWHKEQLRMLEEYVGRRPKTINPRQNKAIMIEPEVPLKRKDQVALDEEMARNLKAQLQAELIEEEKIARKKEEEANIAFIES
ncbi:hypothetical protein Tco_1492469 [Tanacetum coccineum]